MANALPLLLLVSSLVLTQTCFLLGALLPRADEPQYTTKYDNVDIEQILKNDRLLNNYVGCLLNVNPCTADGKELKETLPDAIETDCSKCTEKQRFGSEKVMHFLIDNKPEEWKKLETMYDPTGAYRKRYLDSKDKVTVEEVTTTATN